MLKVLKNKYLSLHWMLQTYGAWIVSFFSLRFRFVLRKSIFRLIVLVGPKNLTKIKMKPMIMMHCERKPDVRCGRRLRRRWQLRWHRQRWQLWQLRQLRQLWQLRQLIIKSRSMKRLCGSGLFKVSLPAKIKTFWRRIASSRKSGYFEV